MDVNYTDGNKNVFAARIDATQPMKAYPGALKIKIGIRESNLRKEFVELHGPKVGDYFVVDEDQDAATILPEAAFKLTFKELE